MRYLALLSLFVLLSVTGFAGQQSDEQAELLVPLSKKLSRSQVDSLNDLARKLPISETDSVLRYALTAYSHAQKNNFQKEEATALLLATKSYYVKGDYKKALEAALRVHEISRRIGFRNGEASALNNIGLVYLAQNDYEQAIDEFKRSLAISEDLNDLEMQSRTNLNIGISYDDLGKPAYAVKYLEKTLLLTKETKNPQIVAMALNRLGETWLHRREYPKAIAAYRRVIDNKNYQNDWENSFAYSGIAESLLQLGDYNGAVRHGLEGLRYARLAKAKWDIERALKTIYTAYEKLGDYENAFIYLREDKAYADSLHNEERERGLNALHLKQKQKENEELYNERAYNLTQLKMSNRVATVVAVLALLLLISQIFIYCFYRQKSRLNQSLIRTSADILEQKEVISRQKDELETVNASKDQLFAIVGHDLRGPFASILQAMEVMKSGDLSDVELRTFLDNFHEKVTTTALMVDNLVFWAENQRNGTKTVPAETSLPKIVNQAITVFDYLTKGKEIEIQHDVRSVQPVWADPDQVRVIIHNLIGNAIKFTPQRGAISIGYNSMTDSVTVYIKDSGVGMPQEKLQKLFSVSGKAISSYGTNKETGIGIGLVLVKEFVEMNNADLEVDSKEGLGTEFRVRFPVVPSENAILQKRATD